MANERFIVIQEWMLELGLTDSELRAFALVYGFSQDSETGYRGGIDYVAHWCQVQRRQAIYILNSLVEKGVVTKRDFPGQTSSYLAKGVQPIAPVQFSTQGGAVRGAEGVQPNAPYNKVDNKEDNKNSSSPARTREDLRKYGEYVRMTSQDYTHLVDRFGYADAKRLCEILDSYLAKKPNAYKNHYRAILGWPVQRLQEEKLTQQRLDNSKQAQQRIANNNGGMASGYGEQAMANARRLEELLKN